MNVRVVGFFSVFLLSHISFLGTEVRAEPAKQFSVSGTITGPDGKPVADALVAEGTTWGSPMRVAKTNGEGKYILEGCPPGSSVLTVVSVGLAPDLRPIEVGEDLESEDFQLKEGQTIQIRLVDKDGKPVPEAHVMAHWWRDHCTLSKVDMPIKTDKAGRWEWTWAPDEAVEFFVIPGQHACLLTGKIKPSESEHVFTVAPPLNISGTVRDAATKKPIEHFAMKLSSVTPSGRDTVGSQSFVAGNRPRGRFEITAGGACEAGARVLTIQADGYKDGVSKPVQEDAGDTKVDFFLERLDD